MSRLLLGLFELLFGVSGLNAVVSWPAEEWGRDPAGFAEMRPGVYDVHERVRDMNRNGRDARPAAGPDTTTDRRPCRR